MLMVRAFVLLQELKRVNPPLRRIKLNPMILVPVNQERNSSDAVEPTFNWSRQSERRQRGEGEIDR